STKKKGAPGDLGGPVPASALGAPRKKAAELEVIEEVDPEEATSIIDTSAYEPYVKSSADVADPEHETSVVDLNKYSAFAQASRPGAALPPPDRLKTDPDMRAVKIPNVAPVLPGGGGPVLGERRSPTVGPGDVKFPGGVLPPPSSPRPARPGKPM